MKTRKVLAACLLAVILLAVSPAGAESPPLITTPRLPEGMSGIHYAFRLLAEGEQPMVWGYASSEGAANSFPDGLDLSESGVISGTPLHSGDYEFALNVTNPAGTATAVFALHLAPFDESRLRQGGQDKQIIGEGDDPLVGLSNGMNGGRLTLQGETAYFIDARGYLNSLGAPFREKPTRLFGAVKYAHIDANEALLFYYHRYLDSEATAKAGQSVYVTYIAADPIAARGRYSLRDLRQPDLSDLKVTRQVLLYIGYDGVMGLVQLDTRAGSDLRTYFQGREVKADHAFPYNGRAWFRQAGTGWLFCAPLDGQVAKPLIPEKVLCFTIAPLADGPRLIFTNAEKKLFSADLGGGDRQPLGKLYASQVNANRDSLFFADAKKGNRLTMIKQDDPASPVQLSSFGVDQIYAFDHYVAFQKKGTRFLYLLALDGQAEPVLISK
ncbi:MAG: putative Ig domain-containing protein [Christensenellales bacterium]